MGKKLTWLKENANKNVIVGTQELFGSLIFTLLGCYIVFGGANTTTKLSGIPILMIGIVSLIISIAKQIYAANIEKMEHDEAVGDYSNVDKLDKTNNFLALLNLNGFKLLFIIFFFLWFMTLIIIDFYLIKNWNEDSWQLILFSFLFWMAGIAFAIKKWKDVF